jgi:hypothetical protein
MGREKGSQGRGYAGARDKQVSGLKKSRLALSQVPKCRLDLEMMTLTSEEEERRKLSAIQLSAGGYRSGVTYRDRA